MTQEELNQYTEDYVETFHRLICEPSHKKTMEVNQGEIRILLYAMKNPNGLYPGKIQDLMKVGSGRVGNALKNLEKKGYIERKEDKLDKRKTLVFITQKGIELCEKKKTMVKNNIALMVKKLGDEDAYHLLRIIQKLASVCQQESLMNKDIKGDQNV